MIIEDGSGQWKHTDSIARGPPTGEWHTSTGWGPVFRVGEKCHIVGVTIEADGQQTETLRVWELFDPLDRAKTTNTPIHECVFECHGGEKYVTIDVTLDPGLYFFERAGTEDSGPLRRLSDADRAEINDTHAPIEFLHGWHPRYSSHEWVYHYFFDLTVEYNVSTPPSDSAEDDCLDLSNHAIKSPVVDQPQPPHYADLREQWENDEITIAEFEQGVETVLAVRGWEYVADKLEGCESE